MSYRLQGIVVGVSAAALAVSWWMLRRKTETALSREKFVSVVREITEAAFEVLFEYSQMTVRVVSASAGTRDPYKSDFSVKTTDSNLIANLDAVQTEILERHSLSVNQLVSAQSALRDPAIDSLASVIPEMLESYGQGEFPVLPAPLWPVTERTDEALLQSIATSLEAKTRLVGELLSADPSEMAAKVEVPDIALTEKNAIARRINESAEFRQRLLVTVMEAQNAVRNNLDS